MMSGTEDVPNTVLSGALLFMKDSQSEEMWL